jgi:hypothetical protein
MGGLIYTHAQQGEAVAKLTTKQNPTSSWWLLVLFIGRRAQEGVGNPNPGIP